ncbi:rhomboid-related protein 2-like [Limulus polyphemus]|uniref:Rhomboid-related protein 2-like n=1 Tax=Limulus polyphemus TaxID=6850 RepID=A0ABM1BIM4_LIMPO|nr:rhomboid-related protein 2-like [Limulus polyphemus]
MRIKTERNQHTPPSRSISKEYDSIEMDRLWRPVFEKYDSDNDGWIPLDELKRILQSDPSEISSDFPEDVLDEILERADWDHNRMLSYEEFLRMVHAMELGSARPKFQRLVRFAAMAVVPRTERATTVRRYLEQYSCMPPPLFMIVASLGELGVFIYYCAKLKELSAAGPVPIESSLIYNPYRRNEAWRFITYMLIHAGAVHIFFNIIIQLLLGIPLEMVHKWWRVGLLYLAGGLAGSLGSSISDPSTFLAGASGGVYALIAAHLANVIVNFKEMEFAWFRLAALFIFGGTDVGVALYYRYYGNGDSRTSYASHFAGALGGLLLGVITLKNLKVHSWEKKLGWIKRITWLTG